MQTLAKNMSFVFKS